jgi:hypothetical protein
MHCPAFAHTQFVWDSGLDGRNSREAALQLWHIRRLRPPYSGCVTPDNINHAIVARKSIRWYERSKVLGKTWLR